jgi:hypothetical protein
MPPWPVGRGPKAGKEGGRPSAALRLHRILHAPRSAQQPCWSARRPWHMSGMPHHRRAADPSFEPSPRHGRRASALGAGAPYQEPQLAYGYAAATPYATAEYGRSEGLGRITTHWSEALGRPPQLDGARTALWRPPGTGLLIISAACPRSGSAPCGAGRRRGGHHVQLPPGQPVPTAPVGAGPPGHHEGQAALAVHPRGRGSCRWGEHCLLPVLQAGRQPGSCRIEAVWPHCTCGASLSPARREQRRGLHAQACSGSCPPAGRAASRCRSTPSQASRWSRWQGLLVGAAAAGTAGRARAARAARLQARALLPKVGRLLVRLVPCACCWPLQHAGVQVCLSAARGSTNASLVANTVRHRCTQGGRVQRRATVPCTASSSGGAPARSAWWRLQLLGQQVATEAGAALAATARRRTTTAAPAAAMVAGWPALAAAGTTTRRRSSSRASSRPGGPCCSGTWGRRPGRRRRPRGLARQVGCCGCGCGCGCRGCGWRALDLSGIDFSGLKDTANHPPHLLCRVAAARPAGQHRRKARQPRRPGCRQASCSCASRQQASLERQLW